MAKFALSVACAVALGVAASACASQESATHPADGSAGEGAAGEGASPSGDAASDGMPFPSGDAGEGGPSPSDAIAPDQDASPATPATGVFTHHNDNARTGQNLRETLLTPSNVDATHFGKKFSQALDGYAYAQPLVVQGVAIPNQGTHDVVYVATEHDSVYAFDANTQQPALWHLSFLSAGVTTVPPADTGENADLVPEIGISGTPVIDPVAGTLYVVAKTKETGPSYHYRLHALDLATGADKLGGPVVVQGQVSGTGADSDGGIVTFDALHDLQRPALLLSGDVVYVAFGDHGDHFNWHGWVFGYDATTLAQKYVWCTTPDANEASIWQSGAGIAADSAGNLYLETGNGDFDGQSGGRDFAMTVLKLSATATVLDWFTPHDYAALSSADIDLGSAGPLVLPDQTGSHPHLVIGSGKPGYFYLLDRDDMGHFRAQDDSQIVQSVTVQPNASGIISGLFASPAYWNGRVYVAAVSDALKAFTLGSGMLSASPVSQSTHVFTYPGATPSISSNGASSGIVWVIEGAGYTPASPAVLHAYDAMDLTRELYTSSQASGGRDTAGRAVKFAVPSVVGGHLYVGTQTELDVYGELP